MVLTKIFDATFAAFGVPGNTYIPAMQNKPVMGNGKLFFRNIVY
jgi:hypothetical protein